MRIGSTDVVVVGSGMAGCGVAGELIRHGARVLVVDLGPDAGRRHLAVTRSCRDHVVAFGSTRTPPHYGPGSGARCAVGGRSLAWRGIVLRLESWALDSWPTAPRAALENGLYAAVEEHLQAWRGASLEAPLSTADAELSSTLRGLGYPEARPMPRAARGGASYTPLDEVASARLKPCTTVEAVERVTERSLRLRLLTASGRTAVDAGALVMAAGTVGSARLLKRLLSDAPTRLPVVDHHAQGWKCALATAGDGIPAGLLVARDVAAASNLFLDAAPAGALTLLDAFALGEQRRSPASTVDVGDGVVTACFTVTLTERDRAVLASQRRLLDGLASALAERLPITRGPAQPVSPGEAAARALASPGNMVPYGCSLGSISHDSSTLPLGGGQVDESGRVPALGPVYVAGPPTFARAGAANPSLTTLALARYTARRVLAGL